MYSVGLLINLITIGVTVSLASFPGHINMTDAPDVGKYSSAAGDVSNMFSWDLYQKLAAANKEANKGNLIYSPLSIHAALMMTYHGARQNTSAEMSKVLHVPDGGSHEQGKLLDTYQTLLKSLSSHDPTYTLHQANRLYVQQGYEIVAEFTKILQNIYDAELGTVDFVKAHEAAQGEINGWVEKQTNMKIKDLLTPGSINPLVRAVIVNAIYFKGIWAKQFNPDETSTMPFYTSKDTNVNVKMMAQKGTFKLSVDEKLKVRALELPYSKNRLSLVIVLPDETCALSEVEVQLTSSKLNALVANTRDVKELKVMIPRFKLELSFSLPEVLKSLGIRDLFSASECNLSGVSSADDLFVSDVIHKAFIEVNEEGSEAAAATAVIMMKRCAMIPPRNLQFIANHPFLFFIRDNKSATILFMGRVQQPTPNAEEYDAADSKK